MKHLQIDLNEHERLVDLFREREQHDPLTAAHGYVQGRIDEFCAQNAIDDLVREAARIEASP